MIISKVYDINCNNIDEVITELAKEIEKGFTVSKIKYEPYECSINTYNNQATAHIYLEKRGLDCRK